MNPSTLQSPLHVLLVDDYPMITVVLERVLSESGEFVVVGALNDGESVMPLLETTPVDILVLDMRLPGMTGLEVISLVRNAYPKIKIAVCSGVGSAHLIAAAYAAGAHTFVEKNLNVTDLLSILRALGRGQTPLPGRSAEVLRTMVSRNLHVKPLAKQDVEILRRFASNQTPKDIAAALQLSLSAIYKARIRLAERTGASNAAEFFRIACDWGLVDPDSSRSVFDRAPVSKPPDLSAAIKTPPSYAR